MPIDPVAVLEAALARAKEGKLTGREAALVKQMAGGQTAEVEVDDQGKPKPSAVQVRAAEEIRRRFSEDGAKVNPIEMIPR